MGRRRIHRRRMSRGAAALALLVTVAGLAGCEGHNVAAGPQAVLLHIDAPMHEPVWSGHDGVLVGLTEHGSRVEKVDPALNPHDATSALSAPMTDLGTNLAPGMPGNGVVYIPQPGLDRVAVLHVATLRQVRTVRVGREPSTLATDVGASTLLALSRDGRTVTGLDLEHNTISTSQRVDAGPDARLVGPERERVVEYHVTGPTRVEHYLAGARRGSVAVQAGDAVGDQTKVTRLYVAESGTDDLVSVDSGRSAGGMEVVGRADLGAPVRYVGDDEHRVYAVTPDRLVVLETRSFGGFVDGRIPVLETVRFRDDLPAALRDARLSGIAVGPTRVYLTFADQPYLLSIAKPNV